MLLYRTWLPQHHLPAPFGGKHRQNTVVSLQMQWEALSQFDPNRLKRAAPLPTRISTSFTLALTYTLSLLTVLSLNVKGGIHSSICFFFLISACFASQFYL